MDAIVLIEGGEFLAFDIEIGPHRKLGENDDFYEFTSSGFYCLVESLDKKTNELYRLQHCVEDEHGGKMYYGNTIWNKAAPGVMDVVDIDDMLE